MSDWTENDLDPQHPHELYRGRWHLLAYDDGTWEVRLCGGHVDDGDAVFPTLGSAKAVALDRVAELCAPFAGEAAKRSTEEHRSMRDCLRALLPDNHALGRLAIELYSAGDGSVGCHVVVTMSRDEDGSGTIALARALRHEIVSLNETLCAAVEATIEARRPK